MPATANWRVSANCIGIDPELFFSDDSEKTRTAQRVCERCYVRKECWDYAVEHHPLEGVWAGTKPRERGPIPRWMERKNKCRKH